MIRFSNKNSRETLVRDDMSSLSSIELGYFGLSGPDSWST